MWLSLLKTTLLKIHFVTLGYQMFLKSFGETTYNYFLTINIYLHFCSIVQQLVATLDSGCAAMIGLTMLCAMNISIDLIHRSISPKTFRTNISIQHLLLSILLDVQKDNRSNSFVPPGHTTYPGALLSPVPWVHLALHPDLVIF